MADTVTYADVRFVKHPEAPERRPRRTGLSQNGDIIYAEIKTQGTAIGSVIVNNDMEENGEIAYANITCTQKSTGKTILGGSGTCDKAWWRALSPYTTHVLLATSLLLLVVAAALGARLCQVSALMAVSTQSLQELKQERETLNIDLDQVTGIHEETQDSLRGTKQLLNQSQEQLLHAEEKLRESEERLRSTQANLRSREEDLVNSANKLQRTTDDLQNSAEKYEDLSYQSYQVQADLKRCRSESKNCQSALTTTKGSLNRVTEAGRISEMKLNQMKLNLKNAKQIMTKGEYFPATTCLNMLNAIDHFSESTKNFEYCQSDWTLISGKCYFFSEVQKPRLSSDRDCINNGSRLAVVMQDDKSLEEFIRRRSQQYWIGLKRNNDKQWMWSDGTQKNTSSDWPAASYQTCAKVSHRLFQEYCNLKFRYICEKPASTCTVSEKFLECFLE